MDKSRETFVYIVETLRPYHIARINHCAAAGMHPVAIELNPAGSMSSQCTFPVEQMSSKAQSSINSKRDIFAELEGLLVAVDPASVVIPGWGYPEALIALKWARIAKRRTVLLSDSNQFDQSRKSHLEWVKRKIVSLHDVALVAGESHKDYLQALGFQGDNIFTGYDVVDNGYFATASQEAYASGLEAKERFDLPEEYMLICSRMIEKKNIAKILHAYSQLPSDGNKFDLVLVGQGELEAPLRQLANELQMADRVHFHGWVAYEDIPTYYAFARGLIHVPMIEQWGLVLNEAAACGLPIISSFTCGAARELVEDGENGFVVDPSSTTAIRDAMISMSRLSEQQRDKMKSRSREIVSLWDLDHFSTSLGKAIERSRNLKGKTLNVMNKHFLSLTARLMGPGVA